jgi:ectoine hydroxylase-related dioxygenase (phytanoyl-CoA dioxygenase family)
MKINNSKKHIKNISKFGYTLIPSILNKSKVKLLSKLINNYYNTDAKRKNPTFKLHKNKDKTVYNLQYKSHEFVKIFSKKIITDIAMFFLNDPFYQFLEPKKPNYILKYYNARSSINKLDLHIDTYMPFKGDKTYMMQFIFLLNDSTIENGCSVAVPKSHKSGKFCNRNSKKLKDITGKAGDLIIWDSRLWHGARQNIKGLDRWALVATLTSWFIKQSMDMPKGLPKKIYNKCSQKEKLFLGYCSVPPKTEFEGINTKSGYNKLI